MNKKRKKIEDDKGFTLVEVLIAVAIIAVIVAPILRGITVSMKVNNRSDSIQKETGVAQGIMEGMSGLSLEEIAIGLSGTNANMDFLTMPAGAHKELASSPGVALTPCVTSTQNADGSYSYEFNKNTSNKYYFGIKDVEFDGKKYDARVILDASKYYNGTDGYNEVDYVDISNYDKLQDGLYVYSESNDTQIAQQIAQDSTALGQTFTVTDVMRVGSRTIRIKVYKDVEQDINGVDHNVTKVDMTAEWEVPTSYVADGAITKAESSKATIFDSMQDDSKELRNLYFLYNPNYKSTNTSSAVRDRIIIENEENIDMNFILVKQDSDEEATMDSNEKMYHLQLESVCATTDGSDPTHIRTNVGYNLHELLYGSDYNNRYVEIPSQCTLILRNTYSNLEQTKIQNQFFSYISKIAGTSKGKERMYTKTVEVWSSGSYDSGFTNGSPLAKISSEL